jgi:hypothetical protein
VGDLEAPITVELHIAAGGDEEGGGGEVGENVEANGEREEKEPLSSGEMALGHRAGWIRAAGLPEGVKKEG